MNQILKKFPTKIKVEDEICDINSDYRNCLKIIMAYEDENLTLEEQHYILLKRLYKTIPQNIERAIEKGILFLNCGEDDNSSDKPISRVYSFDKDYKYIYSAMNQTHNIDLESIVYLHWWKFVFLFMDVNKDCTFSHLISLRDKKNKGKLDKEERKTWIEMRNILDLDYMKEDMEDDDSEFMKLYNQSESVGDDDVQMMVH